MSKLQNRAALEAALAEDPFYRAGIAAHEITEFVPSMVGQGFEILQ